MADYQSSRSTRTSSSRSGAGSGCSYHWDRDQASVTQAFLGGTRALQGISRRLLYTLSVRHSRIQDCFHNFPSEGALLSGHVGLHYAALSQTSKLLSQEHLTREATRDLSGLKQGKRSVCDYTITTDLSALIDSGADESLIDWELAAKLGPHVNWETGTILGSGRAVSITVSSLQPQQVSRLPLTMSLSLLP